MSLADAESKLRSTHGPGPYSLRGNHIEMDLSDEGLEIIDKLLLDSGDTPGDLFRKALGLYWLAVEAKREGKAVGAAPLDALETEFVL